MSNIVKSFSLIISSSILGLSLIFFTTAPGYYGDEENCIELRKYSRIWAIQALVMAAVYGSILVYTYIQNKLYLLQDYHESIQIIDMILTLVILFLVLVTIPLYIRMQQINKKTVDHYLYLFGLQLLFIFV